MRQRRYRSGIVGSVFATLSLATATLLPAAPPPLVLDMVHHNPGEPLFDTAYEDPAVLKAMGFNGKVYYLFDAPTIAIDWEAVDPDIFPKGSPGRAWVDEKAARIDQQHAACKAVGIDVYAMADLVLLPKSLIEKHGLQETFGDVQHPQTQKFLRLMIGQMFDRFPNLDGIVVRVGETYLHDAPFHAGKILNKSDPKKTLIPLMQLLREEVCVKRNKTLVFRTWLSFDTNPNTYTQVSDAVEPHEKLIIGVKHCEGDFHRGHAFSRVLGMGRHRQLIEVQCAREYEGKGAYPNYIAHGVIEGFEEHFKQVSKGSPRSIREVVEQKPELFAGIWTWTRGGGWKGPFITHELWPDLNAWVLAQWAMDTSQSEVSLFNRYATEKLGLTGENVAKFRRLCLLSADAVVRGKSSTHRDFSPWWSRDDGINIPKLPDDPRRLARILDEQAQAVQIWREIVRLAEEIDCPDAKTREFLVASSNYGLHLYRVYQAVIELTAKQSDADHVRTWLAAFDAAWADYAALPARFPQSATLYRPAGAPVGGQGEPLDKFLTRLRHPEGPASSPAK